MEVTFIFIVIALLLSIILHEVAHGYAANWLGDPTARLAGRLTLNPVPHIDPIGSVVIPAVLVLTGSPFLFGWAKPVPYNPYNLRDQKWGEAIVAAAGPAVNILIALFFGLLIRFAVPFGLDAAFIEIATYIVYINLLLAFFNLIPFPPLDGSKIIAAVLPPRAQMRYHAFVEKIQSFGLIFTFLFIFVFVSIFWGPFAALLQTVFSLITGV